MRWDFFDALAAELAASDGYAEPARPEVGGKAFQQAGITEICGSGNLQMSASPYQMMAGMGVARELGIGSDLPGDVIATVTARSMVWLPTDSAGFTHPEGATTTRPAWGAPKFKPLGIGSFCLMRLCSISST